MLLDGSSKHDAARSDTKPDLLIGDVDEVGDIVGENGV